MDNANNQKVFYKMMNNLLNKKSDILLFTHKCLDGFTENVADCFNDKISKLREELSSKCAQNIQLFENAVCCLHLAPGEVVATEAREAWSLGGSTA